ncbi:MAG: SLC13 family permease [Cyclobacteriaceae bacterium]|nr:SLC13 family permease [Cyclobacteriaceae bacterium]
MSELILLSALLVLFIGMLVSGRLPLSIVFLGFLIVLIAFGFMDWREYLISFSNPQIILIFLLIAVTNNYRENFGFAFLDRLLGGESRPKPFLLKLSLLTGSLSAFFNNTPIVAYLMGYVRQWSEQHEVSASKFLIPLSFSAILGGMITVVGTSTTLILNGFLEKEGFRLLSTADLYIPGMLVLLGGMLYFWVRGYAQLPAHPNSALIDQLPGEDFIFETWVPQRSALHGMRVAEAGYRKLKNSFLVEIERGGRRISPVAPEELLESGDRLFFSGSKEGILNLIKEDQRLELPESDHLDLSNFSFAEAIIPADSDLDGVAVNESNFRKRFNASIVAITRRGKKIFQNIGETPIYRGDVLLLLSNAKSLHEANRQQELIFLSHRAKEVPLSQGQKLANYGSLLVLIAGILGGLPLLPAAFACLAIQLLAKLGSLQNIKKEFDLELFIVLTAALAIGHAVSESVLAVELTHFLQQPWWMEHPFVLLFALFFLALLLTSFVTNAAALSILFPVAVAAARAFPEMGHLLFLALAFGASGNFLTPYGYQTNLMVMAAGQYSSKDYFRSGIPISIIYVVIVGGWLLVIGKW